ncbi:MAG: HEAT repeat domain-containing protein, partial [Myxococcales bacterium]|nr:HEAT repeat domain-containing protein [Myxococcales bacterium]
MSEAAAAVRWLLQQAEPEARRVAVQQIAKVRGGVDSADLLLRALGDEDWRVRKEAALMAPSLERREEVVAGLVAALEETVNIGLRNAAVEALVAIGPDAVGATIEALARLEADARKLAIEVLGGIADGRCTTALARALADEDINVRVTAAEALGNAAQAGDESRELATKALVSALATQNTFLKLAALESLARLDAHLPWRVFEPYVGDPLLRRYAIAAACGSREPEAVCALALATGDESPTIAREAIVALGEFVSAGPFDAPLLEVAREAMARTPAGRGNARRAALDAEDSVARSGALPLLGLLRDTEDVPLLVGALGEDVAERADLGLRLFGPEAVRPLLAAARDMRPSVRASALGVAATFDGADAATAAAVREALRAALDDPSAEVIAAAVETLGGRGDAEDLRLIGPLVDHPDPRISAASANAVWNLAARHMDAARALLADGAPDAGRTRLACIVLGGVASRQPLSEREVHVLERALAHDSAAVRQAAVAALAQAGGDAAAQAVVFALADEAHPVQLAAVRALGKLGRAEPLLEVVADTRDPVLTAAALRALGDADPARAVAAAGPLARHSDAAIASAAVEAIGHIASLSMGHATAAACEDALYAALEHPSTEVVTLALSLVGARNGARAFSRLGLCLDHGSSEVRRAAAEMLGQDRGPSAQAFLRTRYEREKDPVVR